MWAIVADEVCTSRFGTSRDLQVPLVAQRHLWVMDVGCDFHGDSVSFSTITVFDHK